MWDKKTRGERDVEMEFRGGGGEVGGVLTKGSEEAMRALGGPHISLSLSLLSFSLSIYLSI